MPSLSLMIKPASSLCNLSCEYCFYRDVSEHREHLGFGMMPTETADILIEKALEFADGQPVAFAFQGGEPTLSAVCRFLSILFRRRKSSTAKTAVFSILSRPTERKSTMILQNSLQKTNSLSG